MNAHHTFIKVCHQPIPESNCIPELNNLRHSTLPRGPIRLPSSPTDAFCALAPCQSSDVCRCCAQAGTISGEDFFSSLSTADALQCSCRCVGARAGLQLCFCWCSSQSMLPCGMRLSKAAGHHSGDLRCQHRRSHPSSRQPPLGSSECVKATMLLTGTCASQAIPPAGCLTLHSSSPRPCFSAGSRAF